MNKTIRVLLCDDQMAIRSHLRRTLASTPWIQIVGEAKGGREGVQMALELVPDAIVMDVSMPDENGIQATKRILAASPEIKVLMFSSETSAEVAQQAFSAGAHGYVVKSGDFEELVHALAVVLTGSQYVSSALCGRPPEVPLNLELESSKGLPRTVPGNGVVRVLLVDDTTYVRERLAELLSALEGVVIVGQAAEGDSAAELMQNLKPDVVVLDIELPGKSGMDLLAGLPKNAERPLVIILSNYDYPVLRRGCAKLGADFYFYKPVEFEKVIEVCEQLARRTQKKSPSPPNP